MVSFHHHCCSLLHFEVFYDSLSLMNATTCWDIILHWIFLLSYYLYIKSKCFSPRTMILFHRHHCWLLYLEVPLLFLLTYEWDHLLGSMHTLEVLFWVIVLSPYIIIVFIPEQWCCFTTTVVDIYILKFLYDYSSSMTATSSWVRWLHRELLCWEINLSLYIIILLSHNNGVVSPAVYQVSFNC